MLNVLRLGCVYGDIMTSHLEDEDGCAPVVDQGSLNFKKVPVALTGEAIATASCLGISTKV